MRQQPDEAFRGLASAFAYATRAGGNLRVITGVPRAAKTFLIDRIANA